MGRIRYRRFDGERRGDCAAHLSAPVGDWADRVIAGASAQIPCQSGQLTQSPHRLRCSSTINQNTRR